ncbi:hypothetical protein ACP4OV_024807 [Aristida adscensionis]
MAGIDLNTVEEEEEEEGEGVEAVRTRGGVCLELWHACAGPVAPLPRKGSAVVYLPQGHLEHVGGDAAGAAAAGVPPHVFCRVVDVDLHADAATDEVYARVSLAPEGEESGRRARDREEEEAAREDGDATRRLARTPHMFCKTLTASDTSTHGGFSVPRRAAEDCFPPLDHTLQRPSQELVAKDLHGTEWKFRHIYRGQPRRHLLTTGWSAFINKKKLVSGDAVLFLRGEDGVLRLGVRRASQLKNVSPFPALHDQCSNHRNLGNVAQALAMKTIFHIYYNPRFTGIIVGSRDAEPLWHGSKWKCLVVRWDDDVECRRPNRISPWEIELTGSVSGSHLCAPNSKRLKPCLPQVNPETVLPTGSVSSDFAGSAGFHKVLQGQELLGFKTHDGTANSASQATEAINFQYRDECRSSVNLSYNILGVPRFGVRSPTGNPGFSYYCSGFGESQRFHKVLQGQEVFRPYEGALVDAHIRTAGMLFERTDGVYQPDGTHASGGAYKWLAPQECGFRQPTKVGLLQASSPSSVLMFPQNTTKIAPFEYESKCLGMDEDGRHVRSGPTQDMERIGQTLSLWPHLVSGKVINECNGAGKMHSPVSDAEHESNSESAIETGCKIFGISLAEKVRSGDEGDSYIANYDSRLQSSKPQMPKSVHEPRPVVGRVVDVSAADMMI